MAMDIGAKFSITAGVQGQQALDKFNQSLRDADKHGGVLGNTMGDLRGAVAGLSVAVAGVAFANMARQAIDSADALNDMAERTGVAGSALSELDYAAKMNGTSLEAVETALKKVSTKAFDAATGNKQAAATFDALGIAVKGTDGSLKSADTLLQEVADVLNTVEDRTTRTALAVEIFGRSGAELIPLMENMRGAREEARKLGVVVGEDFQQAAAEFNDNLDRMGFLSKAFARDLANEVMPTLNRFMNELLAGKEIFGGYWAALKNIGTTNPFNTPMENAAKYKEQVAALEERIEKLASGQNKWFGKDTPEAKAEIAKLNGELENTKKLVEYFNRMAGLTSQAGAGRGVVNPAAAVQGGASILDKIRAANEKDGKTGSKESDFDRLKRQLEDQIMRTQDLGEAEKLLREIQLGRFKDLTPAQQRELEALAREADYKKLLAEGERAAEERRKKVASERERDEQRAQEAQRKQIEGWKEVANPLQKYREELDKLREALAGGLISEEVFARNVDHIEEQIEKFKDLGDKGKDTMKDLQAAIEGWGRGATDAFVDFAFGAKGSFTDMINSMLKDLARMLVQQNVMGPLFKSLGGYITGGGGGGLLSSLFSFDGGGYTGSGTRSGGLDGKGGFLAMMHPRETVIDHTRGQSGGSTMVNITVNADGGQVQGDASAAGKLGGAIASAVQAELLRQRRPGGLLAAA